jgi:hypothetical protein
MVMICYTAGWTASNLGSRRAGGDADEGLTEIVILLFRQGGPVDSVVAILVGDSGIFGTVLIYLTNQL